MNVIMGRVQTHFKLQNKNKHPQKLFLLSFYGCGSTFLIAQTDSSSLSESLTCTFDTKETKLKASRH